MKKLRDVATQLAIDPRKLTEYALNPDHPFGGADKARQFQQQLGYTRDNCELLLRQIRERALAADAIATECDCRGQRYRADLEVMGTAGQRAVIRTGWIIEPGTELMSRVWSLCT